MLPVKLTRAAKRGAFSGTHPFNDRMLAMTPSENTARVGTDSRQQTGTPNNDNTRNPSSDRARKIMQAPGYVPDVDEVRALGVAHQFHGLLSSDHQDIPLATGLGRALEARDGSGAYAALLDLRHRGPVLGRMLDLVEQLYGAGADVEFRALAPTSNGVWSYTWRTGSDRTPILDWLREHDGLRNLYFGMNPRKRHMSGTAKASREADVASRRFVTFDYDAKDASDSDPRWEGAVARLRAAKPIMHVATGNGTHVWFRIEDVADATEIAAMTAPLNTVLRAVGSDPVADAPRIMRLPWSINIPTARKRKRGAKLALAIVTHGPDPDAKVWPWQELTAEIQRTFGLGPEMLATASTSGTSVRRGKSAAPQTRQGSEDLVRAVIERLPNDGPFDDRQAYVAVSAAIFGASGGQPWGFELLVEFEEKYASGCDLDEAEKRWREYERKGVTNDLGTLAYFLQLHNPAGYDEIRGRLAAAAFPPLTREEQAQLSVQCAATSGVPGWVREMNERFALVANVNGIVDVMPGNGSLFEVWRTQHFRDFYNGQRKIASGGPGPAKGLGSAWIDHPHARRYQRLGLWMPSTEPANALNLFRGLPAKSMKGELS